MAVPFLAGVFNILHSSIRCSGARERERADRRDNLVGAKTAIPFVRSFPPPSFRPRAMTRPFFPLSLCRSNCRSIIAAPFVRSVQGRRPPESAERARVSTGHALKDQHSMMRGTMEQGGREGEQTPFLRGSSKSLKQRRPHSISVMTNRGQVPGMSGDGIFELMSSNIQKNLS